MVALGPLKREEERMRLLILANTLPILVEAGDQGPLTAPQLFSPSCASCARSRVNQRRSSFEREVEEQTRQKSNQPNDESMWAKGSCISSTPAVQRELISGGKRETQMSSDDVDSGVWSEGTDKESLGDHKEDDVDNTDASHKKREVMKASTTAEANAFLDDVQQQVKDKIELMTRLEGRLEMMQGIGQQLEEAKRENGLMEQRLREAEDENRALLFKLTALERKNVEVLQEPRNTESHSRSDCCKEACASLRAMVESLKEERVQMLTREEAKEVAEHDWMGERQSEKSEIGKYKKAGEWPGGARVILVAIIAVIVAFAYLHLHCITLDRGTQFPM